MKKILIIIMILTVFPVYADYAGEWKTARPVLKVEESHPCYAWFDEAYAEYMLSKDKKKMEINLHDQFVRSGFWPTRVYNNNGGTWGDEIDHELTGEMLKRVIALVSYIPIDIKETNLPYFLRPNFALLDDFLGHLFRGDIVAKFKFLYPEVTQITFRANERHHPYKIGTLTAGEDFESWNKAFEGIDFVVENLACEQE